MSLQPGSHTVGPENGRLSVQTGRSGAAAKAGHDLRIEVGSWSAQLEVDRDGLPTQLTVDADGSSLRVLEGTGGMKALGDDDKSNIEQTIDEKVLKRAAVRFSSSVVQANGGPDHLVVQGELALMGARHPLAVGLAVGADGALTGDAVVQQTAWGIKPYSALFGALKVADEVRVEFEGRLPTA